MTNKARSEVDLDTSSEEGEFSLEQAKELAGFFLRAPRRHRRLAVFAVCLTASVGFLLMTFWPRSWPCSVRILAQRNLVLPALDNPSLNLPRDAENPTKNAADAILRRDNLVAMVSQLALLNRWDATRQPILRLKDRLTNFGPPPSEEDRLRDMVDLLEKRLSVLADDASITISVDWPDRDIAFDIVSFLQRNFLDARYDTNVNVITEAIKILEDRSKPEQAAVDDALADLTRIEGERLAARHATFPVAAVGRTRPGRLVTAPTDDHAPAVVPEISGDAQDLEDVRHRMRILQDERDRQIAQTQSQLTDARSTLGPLHPTVLALTEKLETLGKPSPELAQLAARERELVAKLAGAPAPVAAPARPATSQPSSAVGIAPPATTSNPPPTGASAGPLLEDPQVALAMTRLQSATTKYNELLTRIEAARIELDVTRAAFKYQYTVVRPPELARAPSKPNGRLILLATIFLSVLSAFLVPGLLDLVRGRLIERWQIERQLKIAVLGELLPPPRQ